MELGQLSDFPFNIPTYKVIVCIEHATVLWADITCVICEYKASQRGASLFTINKLMSGSSLEGKAATKL